MNDKSFCVLMQDGNSCADPSTFAPGCYITRSLLVLEKLPHQQGTPMLPLTFLHSS